MFREIKFGTETQHDSKGGTKYIKTTGVEVSLIGDDVWFQPINSRGTVTESVRVVVAQESLNEVIGFLSEIRDRNAEVAIAARHLAEGHGEEHPVHSRKEWMECRAYGARLGYWEWVAACEESGKGFGPNIETDEHPQENAGT